MSQGMVEGMADGLIVYKLHFLSSSMLKWLPCVYICGATRIIHWRLKGGQIKWAYEYMLEIIILLCQRCTLRCVPGRKICRNFLSPGMWTRTQQSMNDILQEGRLDVKNRNRKG